MASADRARGTCPSPGKSARNRSVIVRSCPGGTSGSGPRPRGSPRTPLPPSPSRPATRPASATLRPCRRRRRPTAHIVAGAGAAAGPGRSAGWGRGPNRQTSNAGPGPRARRRMRYHPYHATLPPSDPSPLRRAFSISGAAPLGAFLLVHLVVNARALWGDEAFASTVAAMQRSRALAVAEYVLVLAPLLVHGAVGAWLVARGEPFADPPPYPPPVAAWVRVTGVVAAAFVAAHLVDLGLPVGPHHPDAAALSSLLVAAPLVDGARGPVARRGLSVRRGSRRVPLRGGLLGHLRKNAPCPGRSPPPPSRRRGGRPGDRRRDHPRLRRRRRLPGDRSAALRGPCAGRYLRHEPAPRRSCT